MKKLLSITIFLCLLCSCGDEDSNEESMDYSEKQTELLKCPDDNHPHAIDLGLPSGTKWSCCNLGAKKPSDYGDYYAWGETEVKQSYLQNTYIYFQNGNYIDIGNDISSTQYDVATMKWGDKWHMPTIEQIYELLYNTTAWWTTNNNVKGIKITGKKNSELFFPASGAYRGDLEGVGSFGNYWSSSEISDIEGHGNAYIIKINENQSHLHACPAVKGHGHTIRPVMK